MSDYLPELSNITKRFPGVLALDHVSFNVRPGEVHVLMGENGAGKSTLMKIIDGIYQPDEGNLFVEGEKVQIHSPVDAISYGISMIHQELNIVLPMTIAENIYLGREPGKTVLLNRKQLNAGARKALQILEMDIDPNRKMSELTVAQRQMVEIAKAVSVGAKIIIMDEPTSAISDKEVAALFEVIRSFRTKGIGIIYISHKMEEINQIADRITVLRDGRSVGTYDAGSITQSELIVKMVGRSIDRMFPEVKLKEPGDEILNVQDLSAGKWFHHISFSLRKGEILGVSGLMGAGRSELAETIFGIRKSSHGEIRVKGEKVSIHSPQDAIAQRMAFITEDRGSSGLNKKTSVKKDISILTLEEYCAFKQIILSEKENRAVDESIRRFRIKVSDKNQGVNSLSGGNQQKIILARWLLSEPEILIMDEPTRGIDVGAKYEIYTIIQDLAAQGKAILMISSEMSEIIGVCDRVIVMHEGELTGELKRGEMTQEKIMRYATGMEGSYEG